MRIELLNQERRDLNNIISDVPKGNARDFIESRLKEIEGLMNELNVNSDNYINLMNYLFDTEISETKTEELTFYKPKIALTYAPPQVGKTNAMIEIIKDCIVKNISVVISSDNKKDQMCQLFSRLINAVETNYESIFENCFITTVENKNFENIVEEMKSYTSFIICCLDNKSQIQKVYEKINSIHENNKINQLCLIHDEADVITKALM